MSAAASSSAKASTSISTTAAPPVPLSPKVSKKEPNEPKDKEPECKQQ